jgi:antirestriction protein ArdC
MAKAEQAYHKRDLYSEVTTRILAELETGAAPWINHGPQQPGIIILTTQRLAGLTADAMSFCFG